MLKKENYGNYIFTTSLAIENYCDDNNINDDKKIKDMYDLLRDYRELNRELIEKRDELVLKMQDTVKYIGESNFILYDDGTLEYNCKKNG